MDRDASPTHSCNMTLPQPHIFLQMHFFDFESEVLEGLLTCIQKMIPDYETLNATNREIEVYRDGTRVFGFGDAIRDRTDFMPNKLLECFNFYLKDEL